MVKIPRRYWIALLPFAFFGALGAVCAIRLVTGAPPGDNPYRSPEWLAYLTASSVVVGAVISGSLIVIIGINDLWEARKRQLRRLQVERLSRANVKPPPAG